MRCARGKPLWPRRPNSRARLAMRSPPSAGTGDPRTAGSDFRAPGDQHGCKEALPPASSTALPGQRQDLASGHRPPPPPRSPAPRLLGVGRYPSRTGRSRPLTSVKSPFAPFYSEQVEPRATRADAELIGVRKIRSQQNRSRRLTGTPPPRPNSRNHGLLTAPNLRPAPRTWVIKLFLELRPAKLGKV